MEQYFTSSGSKYSLILEGHYLYYFFKKLLIQKVDAVHSRIQFSNMAALRLDLKVGHRDEPNSCPSGVYNPGRKRPCISQTEFRARQ